MGDAYMAQLEEYKLQWNSDNPEEIPPSERFWVSQFKWLQSRGYMLRPRYNPEWVPSWRGTKKSYWDCEDAQSNYAACLKDATRISDGLLVAIKMVFPSRQPHEAEIAEYFSTASLASAPKNHCVPLLETLQVPDNDDMLMLVMPFLRPYDNPRFGTIGEAVEYFRQIFEGVQFMHDHHIAHRDCNGKNIMMDATKMYPNGYHPVTLERNKDYRGKATYLSRTECRPKYFLIDFGLSKRYDPKDGPPLELPVRGGDKTVPEFQGERYDEYSDPFATDIYYLGNLVKENFLDRKFGFEFMFSLIDDMTQKDPSKRPTIDQVVVQFEAISRTLNTSHLRSRVAKRKYEPLRWWRVLAHIAQRVRFTLQRIPPVPYSARLAEEAPRPTVPHEDPMGGAPKA